jgi:putative ABC transport system substrate-binding protein
MKRREFITVLGGAATAWPLFARAQQPDRMRRIGVLETVSVTLNAANYDALRQGLRELGYVEGRNLVIEYRSADGRAGRFPELATELIRRDVDLIITRGTPAALAAKNVTATIPPAAPIASASCTIWGRSHRSSHPSMTSCAG